MTSTIEKPQRICTKRNDDGSREHLELHSNGVVFWDCVSAGCSAKFFVDIDFIEDFFTSAGRTFDHSKMPSNFVRYPRNG